MPKNCEPTLCTGIMVSDGVIREAGTGKLSIIGCFNRIRLPSFPAPGPPFMVTPFFTNMRGEPPETLTVTVRIENKMKHVLASAQATISRNAEHSPVLQPTDVLEIPIALPSFNIPGPGVYSIRVIIDGDDMEQTRSLVVQPVTEGSITP